MPLAGFYLTTVSPLAGNSILSILQPVATCAVLVEGILIERAVLPWELNAPVIEDEKFVQVVVAFRRTGFLFLQF